MADETTARGAELVCLAGLQPTRQRAALAELLFGDGNNRHVTAVALHREALELGESLSLATVYNTLHTFCRAGLLKEIVVDGSGSWFDTRVDNHPHFYCQDTRELTDASPENLRLSYDPVVPEGTEISDVDVVIRLRRKKSIDQRLTRVRR